MSYLSWISDRDVEREVSTILKKAVEAKKKAESNLERNVIDPFSVMFEMAGFDIPTVDMWKVSEKARQSQKSLANAFGTFHQGILGSASGWVNFGTGGVVDVGCHSRKIIAEVKNKHSTVKGSDQYTVYESLESLVMPKSSKYHNYTSYYVEVIPKPKSRMPQKYNEEFTPSVKETGTNKPANTLIRRIDGSSFYELVTGDSNALRDLYLVLPEVIKKVSKKRKPDGTEEFIELKQEQITTMLEYFNKAFA